MKLDMSHYDHKSIPYAEFESSSCFSFGDKTSQSFPWKKEMNHQIRLFTLGDGFNFKKVSFYVQNRSSRPKVDPQLNFSSFQVEENFSFCKFLGRLDEKRAAATPDWSILLKCGQNMS